MKSFYVLLEYYFETIRTAIRAAIAVGGWLNCSQKVQHHSLGYLVSRVENRFLHKVEQIILKKADYSQSVQ